MPFPLHRSSCLILITAPHSGCHVPILQLRKQSYFPKLKNLASSGTKTLARTHLWCSVHKSSKARPPWLAGESTLVRLLRKMPKSTPVVGLRVPSGCLSPPGRGSLVPSHFLLSDQYIYGQMSTSSSPFKVLQEVIICIDFSNNKLLANSFSS